MKIKLTSEVDFKEIEVEVEDELFYLAKEIKERYDSPFPMIPSDDGKKINIFIPYGERQLGEKDTHSYKIQITKIPFE